MDSEPKPLPPETGASEPVGLAELHGHPGRQCFPDPVARCVAHGRHACALCHRNPASCIAEDGGCGAWVQDGMHWDTCPNRVRGTDNTSSLKCTGECDPTTGAYTHRADCPVALDPARTTAAADATLADRMLVAQAEYELAAAEARKTVGPFIRPGLVDYMLAAVRPELDRLQQPTPTEPEAVDIEVIEKGRAPTKAGAGSILIPGELRINGRPVYAAGPVSIDPIGLNRDDRGFVPVTVTLVARSITVAAEGDATDGGGA